MTHLPTAWQYHLCLKPLYSPHALRKNNVRRPVDRDKIRRFMEALGAEVEDETRLYFTSGASAVMLGLRPSTNELDIKVEPESDRLFRALPRLEEALDLNIEIATTDQFIPELPGWQERSLFI